MTTQLEVTFRDIDFEDDCDCECLAKWFNQEVRMVSLTQKGNETVESVRKSYLSRGNSNSGAFFILVEEKPVGYASFLINPQVKLSNHSVIWPSITIGEKAFRRKGLVYKLGEELCRKGHLHEATHIEAGIFFHNLPMVSLLKKYGFKEIGKKDVGPQKIASIHYLREIPNLGKMS